MASNILPAIGEANRSYVSVESHLGRAIDQCWRMYQTGQASADHSAREVFEEVLKFFAGIVRNSNLTEYSKMNQEKLNQTLKAVVNELAALLPDPSDPKEKDWPCENQADRECLQRAYLAAATALEETEIKSVIGVEENE